MSSLEFHLVPDWPPLLWVAECRPGGQRVLVRHGPRVEVRENWFCEAVWDGDFEGGAFDAIDHFFGTGGRAIGDSVTFVSSFATFDRLQHATRGGVTFISNALSGLLAAIGDEPDPNVRDYKARVGSIARGIREYERTLPMRGGDVSLVHYFNLVWDGAALREIEKPNLQRDFSSFERYRDFLKSTLARIFQNLRDPARKHALEPVATLSSGYDSTTAVALCAPLGLREVLSCSDARGGGDDSGAETARALGLKHYLVSRDAWRAFPLCELPFLASDGIGEDVYYRGMQEHLAGRVLFSGYHGDVIWGLKAKRELIDDQMRRMGLSGLALMEYRLRAGFIHVVVPFLGTRQIADVQALARGPEMAAWAFPKNYERPVARRLVEEAGVPREAFGMVKRAAAVLMHQQGSHLTPEAEADCAAWLAEQGRSPLKRSALVALTKLYASADPLLLRLIRLTPGRCWPALERWKEQHWDPRDPRVHLFRDEWAWALSRLVRELRR